MDVTFVKEGMTDNECKVESLLINRSHKSKTNVQHSCGVTDKIVGAKTEAEKQCNMNRNMFIYQTSSGSQNSVEDESHLCDVCHKVFKKEEDLKFHRKKHTGDFTCDVCGKEFIFFHTLSAHYETHTGVRRFICEVCDKRFSLKQTLIDHQATHTGQKNYICEVCGSKFSQRSSLNKHIRAKHSEDKDKKSNICDVCERGFSRADTLLEHMKIHTGEQKRKYIRKKEHKCSVCCKIFDKSSHLKVHIRIHTGEKPFYCTMCEKSFRAKYDLTKHSKVHKK